MEQGQAVSDEEMSYADKLRELLEIEASMQDRWEQEKTFELDAPLPGSEEEKKEKYMTNFPFPYMNGRAHLGHTFTFSKCEFSAGFQRMLGKRCTFPFAMHCTGMPIKACADKLKREMEEFGYPPRFPVQTQKPGGGLYQWQIMASMGLTDQEIKPFAEASHWLTYFPQAWITDMKRMGVKIDWRRNYISTEANPYFDSFVQWLFIRMEERKRVKFDKMYTIFSPKENQPCMDHDRSSGEEVGLQEFTLIKLKVQSPYPPKLAPFSNRRVYLVASSRRPETLPGQTNCWVGPGMSYVAIETRTGEVFVCTERAARNMSYQDITASQGLKTMAEFSGQDILGLALEAPLSRHKTIYSLPFDSIHPEQGTGILPSVPADNPEDLKALKHLQVNQSLLEQYGLSRKMLISLDQETVVNGSSGLLAERKTLREQMIKKGEALVYMEPERRVMSRSGNECVVAWCKQWYLDYGAPDWRALSKRCLSKMHLFFDQVRVDFEKTMDELNEHACSRTDGLGSRMPWDRNCLIENMSDSNINMAYYTVCPLIQGYAWDGTKPGPANIRPDQLTPEVWDYVLLRNKPYPSECGIPRATLDQLRREFNYWYPVDDRMSGKDLIPNNLTYYIYGHTAMWPDDESKWPKAIRANGHLLLNSQKMSKSTGNFCTMKEAIERFSADGMRLTLAGAGDGIENANFVEKEAEANMLRLHSFLTWVRHTLQHKSSLRRGDYTFWDRVLARSGSES
ncbi:leucine--tRNA ligase, cytoplasmic [Elysia marginata]|uniref:leucine--tRNA ligase n=1 Tax=Elysia marginata TaxID=1093978 RepID=A0AAV4J6I5_9GAST|nr:leucine--tRNA ligase, cytoplasmic [Elysia marginata]